MNGLDEVEAFLAGKTVGYKVHIPPEIDVKSIRRRLHMTQAKFANAFGFSIDAVKHWEGGRRTPEASARAFLTVIARNPEAVIRALHPSIESQAPRAAMSRVRKPTVGTLGGRASRNQGTSAKRAGRVFDTAAEAREHAERSFGGAISTQKEILNLTTKASAHPAKAGSKRA